jgi:hypothetical protein
MALGGGVFGVELGLNDGLDDVFYIWLLKLIN